MSRGVVDVWPKHLDAVSSLSEIFVPYVTKKLKIGHDHPDQLVEPVGLSLVDPPDVEYQLKMNKDFYEPNRKGICHVSRPQLETITYAMQTFEKKIQLEEGGPFVTRGYFLGAGTGTGKTRELSGLVHECSLNGTKKFMWVTTSQELFAGIQAELEYFNADIKVAKQTISYKLTQEKENPVVLLVTYQGLNERSERNNRELWLGSNFDGLIVFDENHKAKSAYSTKKQSVVGQNVVDLQKQYPDAKFIYSTATSASEVVHLRVMRRLGIWGPGTDFRNEADFIQKIVATGVAGMEVLALRLKQEGVFSSKVVDFSNCKFHCKDALEQKNFDLVYERYSQMWIVLMEFRNRILEEYREELSRVQGKEINKSEFIEEMEDLEDEDLDEESEADEGRRRSNHGSFFCDCLLFFSTIIKSSKVLTASEITRESLKMGKSVIIGLQNTGDTLFEEFLKEPGNEGKPYSNALLILRRAMLNLGIEVGCPKYYGKDFPDGTPLWDWDKDTEEQINARAKNSVWRSRIDYEKLSTPAKNRYTGDGYKTENKMDVFLPYSYGAYFLCEKGPLKRPRKLTWSYEKARRDLTPASLARLYHELSFWLPVNGIDELISRIEQPLEIYPGKFEKFAVAELTGRDKQYKCYKGVWKTEERNAGTLKKKAGKKTGAGAKKIMSSEIDAFMDGKKRVAIISGAASTGVSLHADKSRGNKQQRIHITLEYSYGPENIVQQLGRSNRSNQTCSPEYYIIKSPVPAEVRVTCVAGKRVRQLGAICYGHINGAVITNYLCDDFSTHEQSRAAIEHGFDTAGKIYEELVSAVGLTRIRYSHRKENGSSKKYFTKDLETYAKRVFNKVMVMPLSFQTKFIEEATAFLEKCTESRTIYSPIKDIDLRLYERKNVEILNHDQFNNTSMYHYKIKRWCPWSVVEQGYTFYMRKLPYTHPDIVAVQEQEPGSPEYDEHFVDALFPFCNYKVKIERKKLNTWFRVDPNDEEVNVKHWWFQYSAQPTDMTERRPGCVHVQKKDGCPIYYNARGKHCLQRWGSVEFVLLLNPDFKLVSQMQKKFGCTQLVRLRFELPGKVLKNVIGLVIGQEEIRMKPSEVFNTITVMLRSAELDEEEQLRESEIITSRDDDDEDMNDDDDDEYMDGEEEDDDYVMEEEEDDGDEYMDSDDM